LQATSDFRGFFIGLPKETLASGRKAGGFRTTANQGKGDLNQDCVIGYLRRRNVCDNGRTAPDEHLLQGTPFAVKADMFSQAI